MGTTYDGIVRGYNIHHGCDQEAVKGRAVSPGNGEQGNNAGSKGFGGEEGIEARGEEAQKEENDGGGKFPAAARPGGKREPVRPIRGMVKK